MDTHSIGVQISFLTPVSLAGGIQTDFEWSRIVLNKEIKSPPLSSSADMEYSISTPTAVDNSQEIIYHANYEQLEQNKHKAHREKT